MPEGSPTPSRRPVPALGWTCAGLIALLMLWTFGLRFLRGFTLGFGQNFLVPTPKYTFFLAVYGVVGLAVVLCLTIAFAGLMSLDDRLERLRAVWQSIPDIYWIVGSAAAAVAIPLGVETFIVEGAPLVDDEKAYRFMAELLARGQLTAEAPEPAPFFDRFPMVNRDRYYAQYFLGWPALLAPAVAAGVPGLVNPLASAALALALFLIARRTFGRDWAKLTVVLYLVSPFAMLLAGTLSAHPSCAALLAWTFWFYLRSRDDDSPVWTHAGLALCFSAAFFNRPTTTLGLGSPLLVAWAIDRVHDAREGRLGAGRIAGFAVPSVLLAAAFFAVNWAQNGSPLVISYQAFVDYSHNLGLDFSGVSNFDFEHVSEAPPRTAIALVRLHVASWGWPLMLPIPLLAGMRGRTVRLLWASLGCFLAFHFFLTESGVDLIGPVHFFETLVPLVLLTTGGLRRATQWASGLPDRALSTTYRLDPAAIPLAFATASTLTATAIYMPMRAKNLRKVARRIERPRETVRRRLAPGERAVVFAPVPWVKCDDPPENASLWPPFNSPGFDDRILWLNHLTLEKDRAVARRKYPDRRALLVRWNRRTCRVRVEPLDEVTQSEVEPGYLETIGKGRRKKGGTSFE